MTKIFNLHIGKNALVYKLSLYSEQKVTFADITKQVKNTLKESGAKNGILNIYTRHTTTGVRINENEEYLIRDFKEYLKFIIPDKNKYHHDNFEKRKCQPDERVNACAHIGSLLMGASETIPFLNGKMLLGKWQSIFLVDLDGGRKSAREVIITIIS